MPLTSNGDYALQILAPPEQFIQQIALQIWAVATAKVQSAAGIKRSMCARQCGRLREARDQMIFVQAAQRMYKNRPDKTARDGISSIQCAVEIGLQHPLQLGRSHIVRPANRNHRPQTPGGDIRSQQRHLPTNAHTPAIPVMHRVRVKRGRDLGQSRNRHYGFIRPAMRFACRHTRHPAPESGNADDR